MHQPIFHNFDKSQRLDKLGAFSEALEVWVDLKARLNWRRFLPGKWLKTFARGLAKRKQVLLLIEPDSITGVNRYVLPKAHHAYDVIFSFDQRVLDAVGERGRLLLFGFSMVDKEERVPAEKTPTISTICGHKKQTEGHRLRWDAWALENTPLPLYRCISKFGGPDSPKADATLGDSKMAAFGSQFHLTIENCRIANYFTEKIIDAFLCESVPIYWGCTNIGDFFNPMGFFQINSLDEIPEVFPKDWQAWLVENQAAIQENKEIAKGYVDYHANVAKVISDYLAEAN